MQPEDHTEAVESGSIGGVNLEVLEEVEQQRAVQAEDLALLDLALDATKERGDRRVHIALGTVDRDEEVGEPGAKAHERLHALEARGQV